MAGAAWSRDGRLVGRTSLGRDLVDRKCPVLERVIQPCRCQREAEDHPPKGNLHSLSHACPKPAPSKMARRSLRRGDENSSGRDLHLGEHSEKNVKPSAVWQCKTALSIPKGFRLMKASWKGVRVLAKLY